MIKARAILILLSAILLLGMAQTMAAQEYEIDEQTQFVVIKGRNGVKIRKAPNAKAAKVFTLTEDETLPVIAEQKGWYKLLLPDGKTGWINKALCRISNATLNVNTICDRVYGICEGYDDWTMWMVGQIKGTNLYVCHSAGSTLWLGKKVGNHLVFDQNVYFATGYTEKDYGFEYERSTNTEDYGYYVYYGKSHSITDHQGGIQFRPSSLTKKDIEKLFNGHQQRGQYLFLGPELFANKYANVIFG